MEQLGKKKFTPLPLSLLAIPKNIRAIISRVYRATDHWRNNLSPWHVVQLEPSKQNFYCLLYLLVFSYLEIVARDHILINLLGGIDGWAMTGHPSTITSSHPPLATLYPSISYMKIVARDSILVNLQAEPVAAIGGNGELGGKKLIGSIGHPSIFLCGWLRFFKRA